MVPLRARKTVSGVRRHGSRPSRRPAFEQLERRVVPDAAPPDIAMISATTGDSQSVTYTYQISNSPRSAPLDVAFYRAAAPQFDPSQASQDIKLGDQVLTGTDLNLGTHTETARLAGGLPIDPAHPYVLAVADPQDTRAASDDSNHTASFRTYVIGAVTHGFELTAGLPAWVTTMANSLKQDGYDATIAFDWWPDSTLPVPGMTALAGAKLAASIASTVAQLTPHPAPGDVIDLHLIGHSRGAVVISQAALDLQALERAGAFPQLRAGYLKMTFLDPHPANNVSPVGNPLMAWYSASPGPIGQTGVIFYTRFSAEAQDPPVMLPSNVDDAEVYYQHTSYRDTFSPDESPLVNLTEKYFVNWGVVPILGPDGKPALDPAVHYCDLTGIVHGHYEVHDWYQQNVVPTLTTASPFVCPGNSMPPSPGSIGNSGSAAMAPDAMAYEDRIISQAVFDQSGITAGFLHRLATAEQASPTQKRTVSTAMIGRD